MRSPGGENWLSKPTVDYEEHQHLVVFLAVLVNDAEGAHDKAAFALVRTK